jgi:hypothetical protein
MVMCPVIPIGALALIISCLSAVCITHSLRRRTDLERDTTHTLFGASEQRVLLKL